MEYDLSVHEKVDKEFKKLEKKDKELLKKVYKKLNQILENPYRYKPLKGDLHGSRRVHIGSYVLIYETYEREKIVMVIRFAHHDRIYK